MTLTSLTRAALAAAIAAAAALGVSTAAHAADVDAGAAVVVDRSAYAAGWATAVNRQANLGLTAALRADLAVVAHCRAQLGTLLPVDDEAAFLAGCSDATVATSLEPALVAFVR